MVQPLYLSMEDVVFTMKLPSLVPSNRRGQWSLLHIDAQAPAMRILCLGNFCQRTVVHLWKQMLWRGELLAISGVRVSRLPKRVEYTGARRVHMSESSRAAWKVYRYGIVRDNLFPWAIGQIYWSSMSFDLTARQRR